MRKESSDTHATPTTYAIPEKAHFSLVQIAFFVRLMAHLTETGTNASIQNARLAPDAMGWCFSNMSKEMDAIIDAIHFSADVAGTSRAKAPARNQKRRTKASLRAVVN